MEESGGVVGGGDLEASFKTSGSPCEDWLDLVQRRLTWLHMLMIGDSHEVKRRDASFAPERHSNDDNEYDDDVDGWCSGKTCQIFSFIHKSETLYRNK